MGFPELIPELPTELDGEVEWNGQPFKYRFTNVGAGKWVVHRAHHHDYTGLLTQVGRGLFSYAFTDVVPPQGGEASNETLGMIFTKFL